MYFKIRWLVQYLTNNLSQEKASTELDGHALSFFFTALNDKNSIKHILHECILPAIASDSSSESFLTEIHDAVEFLSEK